MCLEKISKVRPKPAGKGYKVFAGVGTSMLAGQCELRGDMTTGIRLVGEWLKDTEYCNQSPAIPTIKYPLSWHIWKTRRAAERWIEKRVSWVHPLAMENLVVRKVEYRGAHTQGTQEGYRVVVAEEIKILH